MGLRWIVLVLVLLCVGVHVIAQSLSPEILQRSVVSAGDSARLQHIFAKARAGKPITVAVIGGSITQGARATSEENRYGNRIAAWWRQTFPSAHVTFLNAGIGATGSDYASERAQRDLLSHNPDFVVVEFGVNDPNLKSSAETMEGLLRQILKQKQRPAVIQLFMMTEAGTNAQEWHSKVGEYYDLPVLSYRDAIWPEIQSGRMPKAEVMADEVHPNDHGHSIAAEIVDHFLSDTLQAFPINTRAAGIKQLPRPLFTDLFEFTHLYEPLTLAPIQNSGWTLDDKEKCWHANVPRSTLEFEVTGTLVFVQSLRLHAGMGRARVQVDDAPPVTLEGWFEPTWGGWHQTNIVARDLKPGPHKVQIELLSEREPRSDGGEFKIYEIGTAGVR